MDQFNIKPNSHKYKEEQRSLTPEKKDIQKVVSGSTKVKKKSGFSKFLTEFLPAGASSVKTYVIEDILIPTIKKAISGTVDMFLYGSPNRKPGAPAARVSYDRFYTDSVARVEAKPKVGYSYDNVVFDGRGDAEVVLEQMNEIISNYGMVSVADLYELSGMTGNFTDNRYGWYDLRTATVLRGRDGYELQLPRPQPLKN